MNRNCLWVLTRKVLFLYSDIFVSSLILCFLFENSAAYMDCLLAKENLAGNILPMDRLIDEKLFNKVAIITRESYVVVLVENSNSNLFKVK